MFKYCVNILFLFSLYVVYGFIRILYFNNIPQSSSIILYVILQENLINYYYCNKTQCVCASLLK